MTAFAGAVLAVDPGVTSGWALYRDGAVWATGQDDQMWVCEYASSVATDHEGVGLTIVCESYRITQETMRKTRQTASLEIIGALRWVAHRHGRQFVLQTPTDAKRFMTDARLKSLGWWRPGQDHANDALRHLGLFLAKAGDEAVLRA